MEMNNTVEIKQEDSGALQTFAFGSAQLIAAAWNDPAIRKEYEEWLKEKGKQDGNK
ncbi:hypothetical protein [Ileibacterium valens]|uniref:hypothetical protein n=2 Tax=Ileibacterium valens TaxID=1862668 RepID=UPI0025B78244|nr:hypothetical protein [Ileibacterium valens]